MATKKKQDNVRVTSPDGGATRNISNPDLAARLKAYQSRGKGAKFTAPTEGKPTGNKQRGAQQAKEWGDKKRVSQGRSINDTAPAVRAGNGNRPAGTVRNPSPSMYGGGQQPPRPQQPQGNRPSMFTAPVQGPLPQAQQGFTRPPNAIMPSAPVGSFGPQMPQQPQAQPMSPQMMGPQGPPPGYQPPQAAQRGAPPQPQYNPLPQQRPAMPQSGYMPPPVNQNQWQSPTMAQSYNPWGRKW